MDLLEINSIIEKVELAMLSSDKIPIEPTHHFSGGVYIREVTLPKGAYVLGHKHKTACMNIVSTGSVQLIDIETGEVTIVTAPYTFESAAGVRKLAYILEDCVWSNVHITDETDLDKLEDMFIDKSETFKQIEKLQCLSE